MTPSEPHLPSPEVQQFLEDMGLRYEEEGFPRMAGRLAGWLLVCNPPHQTAGELAETLGASASSISNMTRVLMQCGLIERVGIPGSRAAAYRIRTGSWAEIMEGWLTKTRKMRDLADRGLSLLEDEPEDVRQRLVEFREFHRFIERGIPRLLAEWRAERTEP